MCLLPLPSSRRLCVLAVSAGAAPGSTVLVGALDSWVVAREVGSGFRCCLMQASASRLLRPCGPFLHLQYRCCREDVFLHCFQLIFFFLMKFWLQVLLISCSVKRTPENRRVAPTS